MGMLKCHRCKYKCTEQCITCKLGDEDTKYKQYIIDGYEIPQPNNNGSEQVTNLPDEVENKMRIFLYELFDLQYDELCLMKSIMNGLTLTEHGKNMQELSKHNSKCSRFKVFQIRKRLLKKLGQEFSAALLTVGQRRELKKGEQK